MNDKNSYLYQYGLKNKVLNSKKFDPVLNSTKSVKPLLSKQSNAPLVTVDATRNGAGKAEAFLFRKYAELSTITASTIGQTYKRIEVMSLYSVQKTKDTNNDNNNNNEIDENLDSSIQQPESTEEKEVQGSSNNLKRTNQTNRFSLFGAKSKEHKDHPKTAIPMLVPKNSSFISQRKSSEDLNADSSVPTRDKNKKLENKHRPATIHSLIANSRRLNKPLDTALLEELPKLENPKIEPNEPSSSVPKNKEETLPKPIPLEDFIKKPKTKLNSTMHVSVQKLIEKKSKSSSSGSRPGPLARSKTDVNRSKMLVPREKTSIIENKRKLVKPIGPGITSPLMMRSLINRRAQSKTSDSAAQVFVDDLENRYFPVYTQTTVDDIYNATKKDTFNRQAQTVRSILISRELQTDFLRKRNVGMVFAGKKSCKYTNTHYQANVLEHSTQINEHITYGDLICIDWINKNLFNVNVNPFKLIIDDHIRNASVSVCVSSDVCNADMIL